jgi:hypothetical protein
MHLSKNDLFPSILFSFLFLRLTFLSIFASHLIFANLPLLVFIAFLVRFNKRLCLFIFRIRLNPFFKLYYFDIAFIEGDPFYIDFVSKIFEHFLFLSDLCGTFILILLSLVEIIKHLFKLLIDPSKGLLPASSNSPVSHI